MEVRQDVSQGNGKKHFHPDGFNPDKGVLRPNQAGSEAKLIMETGKEERSLYFKTYIENNDEGKAILLAYKEAEKFHLDWLMEMIKDYVAIKTSVKGRRTADFVTIETGVWGNDSRLSHLFKDKKEAEKVRE